METDAGARTSYVGEAVHVCPERKGASNSEEKKKNRKRNDPGKAQSCGAEVKYAGILVWVRPGPH